MVSGEESEVRTYKIVNVIDKYSRELI